MWFVMIALAGLKHINEAWYENWTADLRQKEISKDKLFKFLIF